MMNAQKLVELYLLYETTNKCTRWFKSKQIAAVLGLTGHETGASMRRLQTDSVWLNLTKSGYSKSTTWKISRKERQLPKFDYTELLKVLKDVQAKQDAKKARTKRKPSLIR